MNTKWTIRNQALFVEDKEGSTALRRRVWHGARLKIKPDPVEIQPQVVGMVVRQIAHSELEG